MAQRRNQEIKFNSINNIQAYEDGHGSGIKEANSLNGLPTPAHTNSLKCQHIIYNSESYETLSKQSLANDATDGGNNSVGGGETDDNMAKTALTSNKTYKKFVLPLDIPTPPMSHSYNLNKRLISSYTQCQCDKQVNFVHSHNSCSGFNGGGSGMGIGNGNGNGCASIDSIKNNNNNNNNNHIKNRVNHHISYIQPGSIATTPPPTINENLKLIHQQQKSSSSSSTISTTAGPYLNDHLHQPPPSATASPQLLQHHHMCQQKNFKLQTYPHNQQQHQQHNHNHHRQYQQQFHVHPQQQHQHQQQRHQYQHQHEEQLLAPQLSTSASFYNNAFGSEQYLPQLPQLLDSNYQQQQQNSLTLSQRHMGPRFNRISDKKYMKNLVYSPERLRNIRIMLAIFGVTILAALFGAGLYFMMRDTSGAHKGEHVKPNSTIHLDDILHGKLTSHYFNGSWSRGSNVIYKEDNAIMEFNVITKQKTRLLLDAQKQYTTYEKSPDENYLLLTKNYKKIFRHSYYAEYDIYDIASGQIKPLEIQKQARPLLLVQWAPVGNALIINFERNLYYKPTVFADEIALTDDSNPDITNGIPDWVYEEEVLGSHSAAWFSPDGKKLAFIRFDDTPTQVMTFPVYGEAGDIRFQYPLNRLIPYPKAGSPNPRVKLFTSDLERVVAGSGDHLTEVPVPSALNTEGDYLISVVGWLNNTNVMSVWMNRIQNSAHIQIFNGLSRQRAYSLESKTGWVEFYAPPFRNRDGTRIALILPQLQSDGDEYRHVCVISTASSTAKPEAITKGKYMVTSILHWDKKNDIIFYNANTEKNPEDLHIYAIKASTGQTEKCLTCNLHTSNGVVQTYYLADFNSANEVFIVSLGPGIPQTIVYEWSVGPKNEISLKKLAVWETNENLRQKIKNIAMPTVEFHTFNIADGFKAKVLLQLPPNMDRSGKTKYPMLVDVYGGPDSYAVINRWIIDWGTYLSSNQSIIYAKIDGRGSSLRGQKLLHAIYLKLGTVEVADQINVTRQMQEQFKFIDANHTGIWGWSYGGYAAAMTLATDDKHVFRCAASIAPVTDWTYYDSVYTERYMSGPSMNEMGYDNARLSTKAKQMRGKRFFLAHGTLDDNVHYQQAMMLAKNLEVNDVQFRQISYPDEDHSLLSVRPHLYHSMNKFFGECFEKRHLIHSN